MAKTKKMIQKGVGIHARRVIAYVVIDYYFIFSVCSGFTLCLSMQPDQTESYNPGIYRDSKYEPVKKLEQSGARNASNLVWHVQQSDHRCLLSSALCIFLNHDCICDPCV